MAVSSAFGELEQAVETTAASARCEGYGVAAQPHGRRLVRVRDLPIVRPAGDVALAQAVALDRAGARRAHLVRDQRARPRMRLADRVRPPPSE